MAIIVAAHGPDPGPSAAFDCNQRGCSFHIKDAFVPSHACSWAVVHRARPVTSTRYGLRSRARAVQAQV